MTIPHDKNELTGKTIAGLQKLTRLTIDSARGYSEAANHVSSDELSIAFRAVATHRTYQARGLQRIVALNDREPADGGTSMGAMHRGWLKLRSFVSDGDLAVVEEAVRGEDAIIDAYKSVLLETAGSPMNAMLHAQLAEVKSDREAIQSLRELLEVAA